MIEIHRQTFFHKLGANMVNSNRDGKRTACLLIDIENFHFVNQKFGYDAGEQMLEQCHQRLKSISKLQDTVFRIEAGRIAFILPAVQSPGFAILAMNKVAKTLHDPVNVKTYQIQPVVRIGASVSNAESLERDRLITMAEQALDHAKLHHQDFHLIEQSEESEEISNIAERFLQAMASNDFELYYQPKVNLQTGRVERAEALLRWRLVDMHFVPPEQIIEMAERSGQAFNLTKWILHTALRQLKSWQEQGLQLSVAVNVPACLVHNPDLLFMVQDSLAIWGIEPGNLTIEITETGIIEDLQSGNKNLQKIQDIGVKLSIDDFGTGYSSLSYFKDIPANELKIDKSFVLNLMDHPQDQKLVKLVAKLAHMFDLEVVAEGIETEEVYGFVKKLGCDYGQGYYMAKPMPPEQFLEFVQNEYEFG